MSGTANLLDALRKLKNECVAVIITSDKSYDNLEISRGYHEDDKLGGLILIVAQKVLLN